MFWGITPENWGQLWSGVIGSFVAAVIGGLVALLVVRMTNKQQRVHAREGREIAAIADLVAATGAMLKKYHDGPHAIQDLLLLAEAAATRWEMDSDVEKFGLEIGRWPYHVGLLALDVIKADEADEGENRDAAFDRLSSAQSELRFFATSWPKAGAAKRTWLLAELIKEREKGAQARPGRAADEDTQPVSPM